jgi:hypothetical protein
MVKNKCEPCMSAGMKEAVRKYTDDKTAVKQIDRLPDCPPGQELNICECQGGKVKREPSEYNKFVGTCMKGKNIHGFGEAAPAMKDCARQWREEHPKK